MRLREAKTATKTALAFFYYTYSTSPDCSGNTPELASGSNIQQPVLFPNSRTVERRTVKRACFRSRGRSPQRRIKSPRKHDFPVLEK